MIHEMEMKTPVSILQFLHTALNGQQRRHINIGHLEENTDLAAEAQLFVGDIQKWNVVSVLIAVSLFINIGLQTHRFQHVTVHNARDDTVGIGGLPFERGIQTYLISNNNIQNALRTGLPLRKQRPQTLHESRQFHDGRRMMWTRSVLSVCVAFSEPYRHQTEESNYARLVVPFNMITIGTLTTQ